MAASSRRSTWVLWLGALAAIGVLVWRPTDHGDAWMYGATGRWVLDHHTVPTTDPFSWTFLGHPWQSNGWAWGVVVDVAWRLGGFVGTSLLKPLFVVLIGGAVVFGARTFGARVIPAMVGSIVVVLALVPWISERPHMASFALFALTLGLAYRAAADDRIHVGWLAALFAGMVVWVNVHSVALEGAAVIASMLAALGLSSAWRQRSARPLVAPGAVAVAAVAATLCTPFGATLYSYSASVREVSKETMTEWYPLWRSGSGAVIPTIGLLVAVVLVVRWKAWRRPECLVPLVACAVLELDAVRNGPYLIIAVVVLLVPLAPAYSAGALADRKDLAVVGVVAAVVIAVALSAVPISQLGAPSPLDPVAAAAALPTDCRLRNDYRLGGWIMFHRPDVAVSADGRNDLYGYAGYAQQQYFEDAGVAPAAAAAFSQEGVTCVVAVTGDPIVAALSAKGWRVAAGDSSGVLLLAPGT